jgi:hypothetical protein
MAGDPDKTRQNSLLSTGPRSPEGKAIASRNRTKHGILAKSPPLLDSEDYSTFEGTLQGLIKQYEPQGPLEHHLVSAIAMCMLRQHRAWQAEAVAGDRAAAQETLELHYPEKATGGGIDALLASFTDGSTDRRAPTHPDVLGAERRALVEMADDIESGWYESPRGKAAFKKWCQRPAVEGDSNQGDNYTWALTHIAKAASECCKNYPDPARPQAHDHGHLLMKISGLAYIPGEAPGYGSSYWVEMAFYHRERSEAIAADIADRIAAIDQALATIAHLKDLATRAHSLPEELTRIGQYEARNNRQLAQAIEQLQQLQAARQQQGGITSNSQKRPLKVVGND